MDRLRVALVLALVCVGLQMVSIPYTADYFGSAAGGGIGSLAHLQAGFLLAVAMLDQSRRLIRVCVAASAATWMVSIYRSGSDLAWLGIPLFLAEYFVVVGCARLAGFPREKLHPLGSSEVLRALFVGLLVFPLAWATAGQISIATIYESGLMPTLNATLQTLIAKYFGVLVVTLPTVLMVSEGEGWVRPARVQDRIIPFLALTVLLACATVLWRGLDGEGGRTLAAEIVDYRLLLVAILAWAVMRFPPRVSMPLLALAMLLIVYSVAMSISGLAGSEGVFRLALLAIELMVLQGLILVLYAITRNGRRMHARLTREAMTDTLTGLHNLKALRSRIGKRPPADREIGYLQLDNIERVLGSLGLKAYAALMSAVSKTLGDVAEVYYLTSAQFALRRLSDTGGGVRKWRHIVELLENFEFEWEGRKYRVTPYLGTARIGDGDGDGDALDRAIAAASEAAMQARALRETEPVSAAQVAHGRITPVGLEQSMLERTSNVLGLIRTGQFALHFQPMRRLDQHIAGPVTAGEVVCRLRGANGELLSPSSFTDELESSGRLIELDRAVIRHLFTWLGKHRRALGHLSHIGFNLTGQSLTSSSFMVELIGMMRNAPLNPEVFCVEVTESAIITDIAATQLRLGELRAIGCHIAIDDFGTGVQSFERLKQLPFDMLKIDGSFVRNAIRERRDYELVQASVAIAHAFGATAVAEYVQDKASLDCMRSLGVQWGQGYFVGKPQPIQAL
ncbi:MAG: EAL domain-containing protein, partial [Dokdonella sp.]